MFQAHSYLWHYLWVAPNALLLILALLVWRRGLHRQFPAFFAFAVLSAAGQLSVYAADIAPSVEPETFWRVDWASLLVEGPLKFALVAEIFAKAFGAYLSLARVGKILIRSVGVILVLAAVLAAARAPMDSHFGIISGAHLLEQTIYLIEAGLLLFIFVFSSYFHLSLERPLFGMALGLSISACVHLATWAAMANSDVSNATRYQLDFLNMATYHVCVLIWFYDLLVPAKKPPKSAAPSDEPPTDPPREPSPQDDLEVWNHELERLIHR